MISCDWSDPCFLNYSVKEGWGGNYFTLPLDAFSPRPAPEDVKYMLAELEQLIIERKEGVQWNELISAKTNLAVLMVQTLEECRTSLDLGSRPFVKATLPRVLDQGPDAVAFYFAFVRDSDGRNRIRLRAHTFRHVAGERLWFEYRPRIFRPERTTACARELLSRLPLRFDRDVWLSKVGEFSHWAVEATTPSAVGTLWTQRKAVSFVVGPPGKQWASVFERKEICALQRSGDWVMATTRREKRDPGCILLKCAPGAASFVEQDILSGRRLEFKEAKEILGLAEFSPAFERRHAESPFGELFTWKILAGEIAGLLPFPNSECLPESIDLDGRRNYLVVPLTYKPFLHPEHADPGCLRLVPSEGDSVLIYPWSPLARWEQVIIPIVRCPGADHSVTITRRRVRIDQRRPAATVLQRVAVHAATGQIDVLVKAIEQKHLFHRLFSPVEVVGAFGERWHDLDVLGLHLAIHDILMLANLLPE